MKYKFNVGDRVIMTENGGTYHFSGYSDTPARVGDTFTIASRGVYSRCGESEPVYSIKGEEKESEPNWLNMEDNFEKIKLSWRDRICNSK